VAEGLSNATAEAMALGCPVFATNVGGTSEVIQDGGNGFLMDFTSPETWWEKFIQVEDRALMEKIRQAAWEKANQLFSVHTHATQFREFYLESYDNYKRK
jgi:glycosyltransferase involved in cell wall biosynthesis